MEGREREVDILGLNGEKKGTGWNQEWTQFSQMRKKPSNNTSMFLERAVGEGKSNFPV